MSMSNDDTSYESTTPMPLFPPSTPPPTRGGGASDERPGPAPARREQAEASLSLLIWTTSTSSASNGGSSASLSLSKTPLLREVPQVRRKLTKRDSRGLTSMTGSHPMQPFDADSASAHWSIAATDAASGAAPSGSKSPLGFVGLKGGWLREKPSRTKLASPSVSSDVRKAGWRRATAIFREDGVLSIYGDDHALIQSIHAPSLRANDVRRVDDSLFAMPHVLGIFARPSVFSATRSSSAVPATATGVSASMSSSSTASSQTSRDEPIFLAFPNHAKARRWRGLLRTYAIPELYGSHSSLTPTYRAHRQLDVTVFEARFQSQADTGAHEHRSSHARAAGLKKRLRGKEDFGTATYTSDFASSYPAGADPTESVDSLVGGNPGSLESVVEGEPSSLAASQVLSPLRSASLDSFSQSADMGDVEGARNVSGSLSPVADSESDEDEMRSGPISGISGAARAAALFDTPGSGSNAGASRKTTAESAAGVISGSGPPTSFANSNFCACYCLIRLAGAVVARTKVRGGGTGSIVWVEKFTLSDLPALSGLQVDVIASQRAGKYALIGHVDLPLETMRRGEDVEGWFPIWATRKVEDLAHVKVKADPSYGREMVGELKMVIRVREETILHRSKYKEVEKALAAPESVGLVRALSKELDDDRLISYLVDIWTSSLTIVQRLADLADAESANFGSKLEPELLFRGNTLLSRSLDKFQRLYCSDWLDASIGGIVRRICTERIWLDADDSRAPSAGASATMSTDSSAPGLSRTLSQTSDEHHGSGGGGTVEQLKRLSTEVWDSIYGNRHACPYDLRRALNHIRTTVNAKFTHVKPPGPGFQGVGAFVFLRLICPAITTPHLYGLMAVAPDARSARTLMLVAKVFLALANKRPAFDKDKEPWLVQANDFLRTQSAAYEDYITAVSTEPPEDVPNKATPLGDDAKDFALQKVVQSRIARLTTLHRESIPTPTYMLDRPLALASLVSYVVRSSPIRQDMGGAESSHATAENDEEPEEEGHEALMAFLDACCDIEDEAGYCLDRAGYDPKPLEMERDEMPPVGPLRGVLTATSVTAGKVVLGSLPPDVRQTESLGGNDVRVSPASRARRATVSVIGAKGQSRSTSGAASRFGENSNPSFGEQLPERGGLGPGWSQPESAEYSDDELRAAYGLQSSGSGDGSTTQISPSTSSRRHSSDIAGKLSRRGTTSATSSHTRRNMTLEEALRDDEHDAASARSGGRARSHRRPLAGDEQVSGGSDDDDVGAFESTAGQFSAQASAKGKRRSKSWWRR